MPHGCFCGSFLKRTALGRQLRVRRLAGHGRRPSAFLVYVYRWGATATLSLGRLAEETGLSKRAVQAAVGHLERRKLIRIDRPAATAVPAYEVLRPWKRGK